MNYDEAYSYVIDFLSRKPTPPGGYYLRGCDLSLSVVVRTYMMEHENVIGDQHPITDARIRELSPPFYEAIWDLARRGIIRPGPREFGASEPHMGGYSVTVYGAKWLNQTTEQRFIGLAPGRFNELVTRFRDLYGEAFYERAVQATLCYDANAFLACCVMCGAAAESVLLALAIERSGDEAQVTAEYKTATGRGRIETRLTGHLKDPAKKEFRGLAELINYWRGEAAHGAASHIGEIEASLARDRMLRFAHYCEERRDDLTGKLARIPKGGP